MGSHHLYSWIKPPSHKSYTSNPQFRGGRLWNFTSNQLQIKYASPLWGTNQLQIEYPDSHIFPNQLQIKYPPKIARSNQIQIKYCMIHLKPNQLQIKYSSEEKIPNQLQIKYFSDVNISNQIQIKFENDIFEIKYKSNMPIPYLKLNTNQIFICHGGRRTNGIFIIINSNQHWQLNHRPCLLTI